MPKLISPEKARRIAYAWHGGQSTPLYALASSGLVRDPLAVFAEINECRAYGLSANLRELDQLERYLEYHLIPTAPGAKWEYYYVPWANPDMVNQVSTAALND